jgi:chromate transporter
MISFAQLAAYFLRLGVIGFGGPPAHIALMHNDLVEKQRWLSAEQFSSDLATANLIPGPTSTEMAIYCGYRLRGTAGAVLAGSLFILPAFALVFALSVVYVTYGEQDWLQTLLLSIKPVALALVVNGVLQLGKSIASSHFEAALFFGAMLSIILVRIDVLLIFVLAGIVAVALRLGLGVPVTVLAAPWMAPAAATAVSATAVLFAFLKIGLVIYGGGFALIGILQQEFVNTLGWISQRELLDGIAIGQSTPGPVFTTATFIGYLVAGPAGAIAATIGIFAPAFAFVLLENALLKNLKDKPVFKTFLLGVNCAVVASLVVSAAQLARDALPDAVSIVLALAAFGALLWKKIDAHWLVGAAVLIGVLRVMLL